MTGKAAADEACFASLCSQAAVGLANKKGDVLATLKGLAADQGMRAPARGHARRKPDYRGQCPAREDRRAQGDGGGRRLAGKAAQGTLVSGTVQAGVGTALYGGNPGQNLLNSLRSAAVDALGENAANEIGKAASKGDIDSVTHLIAHAAFGRAMAVTEGKDAVSGAIGGGGGVGLRSSAC